MAVIAINQQIGSRGVELGTLVAEHLGYEFMSREDVVREASTVYDVDPAQFLIVDTRHPHFWERSKADTERLLTFLQSVLLKHLVKDRVVFVGSTGAHLLPQCGGGIRARVVAGLQSRIERVMVEEQLERPAAEKRVRDNDREIRSRTHAVTGVDLDDPTFYHMVLNTSLTSMEALAAALEACATRIDAHHGDGFRHLRDVSLVVQVRAALLSHPKFGAAQIEVRCADGVVYLQGAGLVAPWNALAVQVARQVEGVDQVEVGSQEPPLPYRSE